MPTLRAATAPLEQMLNDVLGDEITYVSAGGVAATFNAWVEFGTIDIATPASRAASERILLELPYAKRALPSRDDRVTIALRPGNLYAPAEWDAAPTGEGWRIVLKRVTA